MMPVEHLVLRAVRAAVRAGLDQVGCRELELVAAGLEVVGDQVAGDRDQPGAEVAALPGVGGDPSQRPQERLAGQVLGERVVVDPVGDVAVHDVDVRVVQLAERLAVAGLRGATSAMIRGLLAGRLGRRRGAGDPGRGVPRLVADRAGGAGALRCATLIRHCGRRAGTWLRDCAADGTASRNAARPSGSTSWRAECRHAAVMAQSRAGGARSVRAAWCLHDTPDEPDATMANSGYFSLVTGRVIQRWRRGREASGSGARLALVRAARAGVVAPADLGR